MHGRARQTNGNIKLPIGRAVCCARQLEFFFPSKRNSEGSSPYCIPNVFPSFAILSFEDLRKGVASPNSVQESEGVPKIALSRGIRAHEHRERAEVESGLPEVLKILEPKCRKHCPCVPLKVNRSLTRGERIVGFKRAIGQTVAGSSGYRGGFGERGPSSGGARGAAVGRDCSGSEDGRCASRASITFL